MIKLPIRFLYISLMVSFLWSTSGLSADNFCLGDKPVDSLSSGIGFFTKDNAMCVPSSIKKAAKSIFELRVLAGSRKESFRSVDLTTAEGAALKDRIKAIAPSLSFDEKDKIVLLEQLEHCEKHDSIEAKKNCIFTMDIRKSTGFIAGDSLSLWTNSHVVEGYIDALKSFGKKSVEDVKNERRAMRIFLFDSNGRLVLNPYENKITIEELPEKSFMAKFRNSFYAEDTDFVQLKISKAIATPIPISKDSLKINDQVFLAGYSACTGCEPMSEGADPNDFLDRGDGKNSDGYGIKYSTGYVLEGRKLWSSFFGLSEQSVGLFQLDKMLFYSADSQYGNSGGPILNVNGEVIGIHAGGLTKKENGTLNRVSRGILFPTAAK